MLLAVGIVAFALLIFASVCLHEAGHMVTAKAFGMKVTRYFAGFGPTLFSFKRGETEYGLKAIPLGGFVKIVGMTPQDDDVEPGDEARAMWRFPVWKRTIVMSAGSITHFILGFMLLWVAFAFTAMPTPAATKFSSADVATLDNYAPYVSVVPCVPVQNDPNASCSNDNSPALKAGIKDGDRITAVGATQVATYGQLVDAVRGSTNPHVNLTVLRNGTTVQVPVDLLTVQRPPFDNPKGTVSQTFALGIGLTLAPNVALTEHYGPVRGVSQAGVAYGQAFSGIGSALKSLPSKVPNLWSAISGKPRDPNGPISIVGASEIGGQSVSRGLWSLFFLLGASLNLFVGVFNLLPLLPLDGGHIAIAWYEKLRSWFARRRKRPDPGRVDYFKLMPVTYVVIVIFGGFSLLTILADIVNPINIVGK